METGDSCFSRADMDLRNGTPNSQQFDTTIIIQRWIEDLMDSAKRYQEEWRRNPNDLYQSGILFAYYDVLSKLSNAAVSFGVDPKTLGLPENLEREVL